MKQLDRALQKMRLRAVMPLIQAGARVLDIGCADGTLLPSVPLDRYVGVDPDAPRTSSQPNARFIRDTFPTTQLDPAERFDVVVMTAVLEHVPLEAQPGVARAVARHLAPDGLLVITVPAPIVDRIIELLKRASLLDGMREDQHYGFDPRTTPSVFEPHGFHLERHTRFELGLNHLFVLRRVGTQSPAS